MEYRSIFFGSRDCAGNTEFFLKIDLMIEPVKTQFFSKH